MVHKRANAAITLQISSFPLLAEPSLAHHIAIITHATTMAINEERRITVINIFVSHKTKRGNASVSVMVIVFGSTLNKCAAFSASISSEVRRTMHLPIKGTLVRRDTPQQ